MRLLRFILGTLLLVGAASASAAPPVQSWKEIAARRGPLAAARLRNVLSAAQVGATGQSVPLDLSGNRHYRALVILLQFTDQPADTLNHTPADYDSLLFSLGTQPTGSLRDYYQEVSHGRFDITGVVTRWYTAPHHHFPKARPQPLSSSSFPWI